MEITSYTPLDFALADFFTDRSGFTDEERTRFNGIILELSSAQGEGHSCIELADEELSLLVKCRLVYVSSLPLEKTAQPLVLEGSRLYLNRYWRYETKLVTNIMQRIQHKVEIIENTALLDKYFPKAGSASETDWQRQAAKSASEQAFTIITGGPGTGKTTTVLKILALLQELYRGELAISLAAPTGKAAMRLQQSLRDGKHELTLNNQDLLGRIPDEVSTLHRLLGPIKLSNQFRHTTHRPLSCDVLVVDESSMIDLAMMSKVLDALSPSARLILLGDKDQLASVESGAVLNDLCSSLADQTIELQKTWRFSGPIKDLALAVNAQQANSAWSLLVQPTSVKNTKSPASQQYSLFDELPVERREPDSESIAKSDLNSVDVSTKASVQLIQVNWQLHIIEHYQPYLSQVKADTDPEAALNVFSRFQVLAAIRQGEYGVEGINKVIEKQLHSAQLQTHLPWYHGKPVMITRNDPSLGLFNGDIGICLKDNDRSQLRVWFKQSDGGFRAIIPARLPQHETVYAMTIHKSQGSEFDHVMIVLPDKPVPLLSKELLYTGITRARKNVDITANEAVFAFAVNQRVVRNSGIQSKLQASMIDN